MTFYINHDNVNYGCGLFVKDKKGEEKFIIAADTEYDLLKAIIKEYINERSNIT